MCTKTTSTSSNFHVAHFLPVFLSWFIEDIEASCDNQFSVKSSGRTRIVDLATPSCSCNDWVQQLHGLPCKHMFAVFRNVLGHSWESLPESYRSSAKLSLDVNLIHTD